MKLHTILLALLPAWQVAAGPVTIPLQARAVSPGEHLPQSRKTSAFSKRSSGHIHGQRGGVNVPLWEWSQHHADLQWYATIGIGTPPQNMTVLFDTGSSSILAPRSNCTTCGGHRAFDPSESTTFSALPGGRYSLLFGTGGDTVPFATPQGGEATMVTDTVSINGLAAPAVQFFLVEHEDSALAEQPVDGIAGIQPVIRQSGDWYWKLYNSGQIDSPVFSFLLPANQAAAAQLTLGGIDDTKYSGAIDYVSLNESIVMEYGAWVMDFTAVYINNTLFHTLGGPRSYLTSDMMVLDTGTSFIMAPSSNITRDLYAQISSRIYQIDPVGVWGAPCDVLDSLAQDLVFTVGPSDDVQKNLTLPKEAFNLGEYISLPGICQAVFNEPFEPEYGQDGRAVWVIGSPLIKQYYTVWDGIDLEIGFAKPVY